MAAIRLVPTPGQMGCAVVGAPAFPGDAFGLGFPEAIGDAARAVWFGGPKVEWTEAADGAWLQTGRMAGELSWQMTLTPADDYVDALIRLTNEGPRPWAHGMAFNCFQTGGPAAIRDHDCVRHWAGCEGRLRRLIELPRHYGPRPAIQLYSVEGAPPGAEIPFVASFQATPDVVLEGWLAIVARDGRRLVAAASRRALFLFNNMEYSCIHSAPDLGPMAPGETAEALTRVYFVEDSLEDWHARMRAEMS